MNIPTPYSYDLIIGDSKEIVVSNKRVNDVDGLSWSEKCEEA